MNQSTRPLEIRRERRGTVLVLALIVVLVVGMMATSFLQLNASATKRQAMAVDNKMAFYVAEAGLAESFASLVAGQSGAVGSEVDPAFYGDGLVWVEPTPLDANHVQLESYGYSGRGRAHLSVVAKQGYTDPAQFGIFTNQDLVIPEGTAIDGFESAAEEDPGGSGGFAGSPQQTTTGGVVGGGIGGGSAETTEEETIFARIGSNGSVSVSSSATKPTVIVGDIEYGPEGSQTFTGNPEHDGKVSQATMAVDLPAITFPAADQTSNLTHDAGTPLVIDPGVHGYGDVQVGAESQLVLTGPVTLLVDNLMMNSGSTLVVDERNGPVEIFARQHVQLRPRSFFAQLAGSTTSFRLQIGGSQTSTLGAVGELHGFVYAPNGTLALQPMLTCFGSLVADSLTIAAGTTLSFDKSLADEAAMAAIPRMASWRLVELDEIDAPRGMDVFASMGLSPATMTQLKDAVDDPTLQIAYLRRSDQMRLTWSGNYRAFVDWLDVEKVGIMSKDGVPLDAAQITRVNERLRLMYERHLEAQADVAGNVETEDVNPRDLNLDD